MSELMKRKDQILETLEKAGRPLTATELAVLVGVDLRNLSKLTKPLIEEMKIYEDIQQEGKIRTKKYSLRPSTDLKMAPIDFPKQNLQYIQTLIEKPEVREYFGFVDVNEFLRAGSRNLIQEVHQTLKELKLNSKARKTKKKDKSSRLTE